METKHLIPSWKINLLEENHDLETRIARLTAFLDSGESHELSTSDRILLGKQLNVMKALQEILVARIQNTKIN
jgi:hypothetical protein